MENEKITYLQMIQEPINRLSTIGSIFKGFTATMIAAIVMINYETISTIILSLSIFIVIIFMILDAYYLSLERKFRYLYNLVLKDEVEIDFSMNISKNIIDIKKSKSSLIKCIYSKTILLFYGSLIFIMIIVVCLKHFGII